MPMVEQKRTTVWISHRGLKTHHVENTLAAFEDAIAGGYQHLETDLRSTADGQIVLLHDPDLARLVGRPMLVATSTASELRELRVSDGQGLLFFDEFMNRFGQYGLTFDIKPEDGERTLAIMAGWLRAQKSPDELLQRYRFLFWRREQQSWWQTEFPAAKCLATEAECIWAGLAMAFRLPLPRAVRPGQTYAVTHSFGGVVTMRPSVVARYHSRGAKTLAYLPKDAREIQAALAAGVDEILCYGPITAELSDRTSS